MTTAVNNNSGVSKSLLDTMNPGKAGEGSEIAAAQDRFMTLLVAQMKNQDPLNPLDNAQVTSQLAQLSTVTGIDKLNATVQSLQASYQSSQTLAAASMIGHGVFAPGDRVTLQESKSVFGVELSESVDRVSVEIKNGAGQVVRTMDIGAQSAGSVPLTWDGTLDAGGKAPDGSYTFAITTTRGGEKINVATGLSFGEVASVSTNAQGVKLNVMGVGPIDLSQIRQIL